MRAAAEDAGRVRRPQHLLSPSRCRRSASPTTPLAARPWRGSWSPAAPATSAATPPRRCTAAGHDVVVLDNLSAGHREAVPLRRAAGARRRYHRSSRRCARRCASIGIDAVMHFAAWLAVGESVRDPASTTATTSTGALGVLEAMARRGRRRGFVFSSTCAVYGEPIETADQRDASDSADQRLRRDRSWRSSGRCRTSSAAHGIKSIALRYFNAAGADPDGETRRRPRTRNPPHPAAIDAATRRHAACRSSATTIRRPTAPACATTSTSADLADAHVKALDARSRPARPRTRYNLGTGRPHSVKRGDRHGRARRRRDRCRGRRRRAAPGDPAVLYAASDRAQAELGWQPQCRRPRDHRAARLAVARSATRTGTGPSHRDADATHSSGCSATPRPYRRVMAGRVRGDGRSTRSASAGLACADQADLRSTCCRHASRSGSVAWRDPRPSTSLKGLGSYLSSYLMADVGQRVVMDLRNAAVRAHPRPVGGVLRAAHHRPADVAHQQRRRPGAAGGVRDDRRPGARVAHAGRLCGLAVLLRRAAGARLPHRRAAHRLSAGPPRAARAQRRRGAARRRSSALSHVSAEAFTGHRIVKAFGAEGREAAKFARRLAGSLPHQHEGDRRAVAAAAADGVARRPRPWLARLWYGSREIAAGG